MTKGCILRAEGLTVAYREQVVIDSVDLAIEKGKIYAIIGPNGCGKTSLLKALSRSMKPLSGKVLLEERDIFKMSSKGLARKMAVLCQQKDTTGDLTVRSLVEYGRFSHREWWRGLQKGDRQIVDWALEKTGMLKHQHKRLNSLSGGEGQRAWIAMALAQKPDILLLDEPTTYLDIAHQLEVMALVARLNQEEGITILMVLHDINHAARYANEIIVIKDKKIYRQGDPWTILEGETLREVFKVEASVICDEESNIPVFYPKRVIGGDSDEANLCSRIGSGDKISGCSR